MSKTNLALKAKMRPKMYTPLQAAMYEPCKCDPRPVVDHVAIERQLTGRFNVAKKNLCETCKTYKSKNGQCLCEE